VECGRHVFVGKRFPLAECNAAPFLQRCCAILPEFTGVDPLQLCDELGLGRLKGWIKAVLARPSVVKTGVSMEGMRLFTELCGSAFSYFPLLRLRACTTADGMLDSAALEGE
jgi:hypothetical protein